jgi:hypothetical protein
MQMIDVMKRLAELDAGNPNIVKESTVAECGMMPMPGMGGSHTPASINMTADSGPELTGMLRDIMQLAGVQQAPAEPTAMGIEVEPLTAEPMGGIEEPMPSAGEKMRSVLDKLNPEPAGDEGGDELGPFQGGGDEGGDDQGGDENPFGSDEKDDGEELSFGNDAGEEDEEDDEEDETPEGQYDNSPADSEPTEPFDSNEYAHQENQPGAGNTSSGQERQRNMPTATFENLMKEYKYFIGEAEDEDTDEGIMDKAKAFGKKVLDKVGHGDDEDMIKDLQKKAGVPQTGKKPEKANESMADMLRLSGLRK